MIKWSILPNNFPDPQDMKELETEDIEVLEGSSSRKSKRATEAEKEKRAEYIRKNYYEEILEREEDKSDDKKTIHINLDNFPPRAEILQPREAMDATFNKELGEATNAILK